MALSVWDELYYQGASTLCLHVLDKRHLILPFNVNTK